MDPGESRPPQDEQSAREDEPHKREVEQESVGANPAGQSNSPRATVTAEPPRNTRRSVTRTATVPPRAEAW